jgi:predicted secreted protein
MLREIINFVFIYIMTFWLLIFCILPIGIKTEDSPIQGNDRGAPKNPSIKKRLIYNAVVSFILVSIYFILKGYGVIDLDNWVNG